MNFALKHDDQYWPVFAGVSFDLWEPDRGEYYAVAKAARLVGELQNRRVAGSRRRNSPFSEFSSDVIADPHTLPCLRPRIAFRRITRATDSRTVRAALVPPRVFLVDTAPYLLWPVGNETDEAFLLGFLSSLALDWYSRRFVETHLDFHMLSPLPIPTSEPDNSLRERVVHIAGRLASPDDRFVKWAEAVGVGCGPLPADDKNDMIQELDAAVAHLYGLSEAHLVHIFETFHEGWDYQDRLDATLRHFRKLKRLA